MYYSLLSSETDTHPTPSEDLTWEQFCELFKNHSIQSTKSGRAYIPARTVSRRDSDIRQLEAAVFDLEGENHTQLSDEAMRGVCERLQGLDSVLHTTYSGHGHYRLILRLSSPVPVERWATFWREVVDAYQLPVDESCKNPSRIYYWPSSPDGRGFTEISVGVPLDSERFKTPSEGLLSTATTTPLHGLVKESSSADLEPLRKCLKGIRKKEHHDLAQRILTGAPLANPGARDNTINRAASLLATLTDGASLPGVVALVEPSLTAMHTDPEGEQFWLRKFSDCYGRALERVRAKLARKAEDAALFKSIESPNEEGGADWQSQLIPRTNKDGEVTGVLDNEANISLIISEDNEWKGKLRFNALTKQIENSGPVSTELATLDVNTAIWLQRSDYRLNVRPQQVGPVLLSVARHHVFDPLQDYLNSLRWDGKNRNAEFFIRYFGSEDTPYVRLISERWLISAAARGLVPGTKMENVLVLEGIQGAGKSKALRALSTPFFTDTPINVHDKDSRILAAMTWVVELAELTSMRRADKDTLKNFFSACDDMLRPPFGKVQEKFLRRAVFVGSTNDEEYLIDATGNRRYWPVKVADTIPTEPIMEDRDQIWAEAVERFREGKKHYLDTPEERALAEKEATARLSGETATEIILDWLLAKTPDQRSQEYKITEILQGAFALMPDGMGEKHVQNVGRALTKLGFTRARKRVANQRFWSYKTPEALLSAPKTEKKTNATFA